MTQRTEKKSITHKIDHAIDSLLFTNDPGYMERIEKEARTKAVQSLGIQNLETTATELKQLE
jgi:hypothetical protein